MQTKKRTDSGTPTLSWCIIARNCEDTIENTLKSLRERTPQAEIVVVDTCSSDSTPEIAQRYADVYEEYRGPRGDWDTEMPAFDDAGAARQRSFEIASGVWRGWIDTDDILPGPDEVERLLKLNGRWKSDLGERETIDTVGEPMSLEEMLEYVDENHDEVACINAPYLYQRDSEDRAIVWQSRERIVRWSDNWKWMEKSHEVLCPVDATFGTRLDFSTLLFVHEKVHDDAANKYALERHFKVMIKQYEDGEVTTRRCLYLAQYAKKLCPEREAEFIDAAHYSAGNRLDRYRAKIAEAEYYIARGLYTDQREALGAAVEIVPSLPDAWIVGGTAAALAEDWSRARTWFERALQQKVTADSLLVPRQMQVWYPIQLAAIYDKLAGLQIESGEFDEANKLYSLAEHRLYDALTSDSIGPDRERTAAIYRKVINARKGNQSAVEIAKLATYLVNNDETAKVLDLIKSIPHTIEDHPLTIELERWSKRLRTHLTDDKAYKDFYLNSEDHGIQTASPEHMIQATSDVSKEWTARAHWAADIIQKTCPTGTIVDIGCYDGLSALPILQLCPGIKYVGIDLNEAASQRLRERFERAGVSDRTTVLVNPNTDPTQFMSDLMEQRGGEKFDLAMWFEVIEHVPVMKTYLDALLGAVKDDGQLLISTPWGSFDDGQPAKEDKPRDERGHVRAMTARDFVREMDESSVHVGQLYNHVMAAQNGADTLHASVSKAKEFSEAPVAFAVFSALWNWNSTEIHNGGFGASEETICYMGENLASDRKVNVFGPVPEEEVQGSVGYWPKAQLRHITPDTKVVVSRAPAWGAAIDDIIGFKTEKYLWLQDARYQDLTEEVVAAYKKIVCVGDWQMGMMNKMHGVPFEKMEVIGNFLMPEHFVIDDAPKREPHHFIYASSPDRGLINLLRLWPEVLNLYPDATLDIFYGWRGMNKLGSGVMGGDAWVSRFENVRRQYEKLRYQKGVRERGMVSHSQIAREYMRASAWTYPTDFTETFCSNAVKARAAGCVPVTTGLAALNETAVCDQSIVIPVDENMSSLPDDYNEKWLAGLVQAVETSDADRRLMSDKAIAEYRIEVQAAKWRKLLG